MFLNKPAKETYKTENCFSLYIAFYVKDKIYKIGNLRKSVLFYNKTRN